MRYIHNKDFILLRKLLVHRKQWCKNMNFEKCTIMPGFYKSGHICLGSGELYCILHPYKLRFPTLMLN